MSNSSRSRLIGPYSLRVEADQILTPSEVAHHIENMERTSEGSLRSVIGPCPLIPDYGQGSPAYGKNHGICHARFANGREVLLLHTATELWVWEGWNRSWSVLIGSGGQIDELLPNSGRPHYPTQFVITPTGIVIIPGGDSYYRPYFYDGEAIGYLGYARPPGTPFGTGPETGVADDYPSANGHGYRVDWSSMNNTRNSIQHDSFGRGNLGTVEASSGLVPSFATEANTSSGRVLNGEFRAVVQFIDRWGNTSPISAPSNIVPISQQESYNDGTEAYPVENTLKQLLWSHIAQGPFGTIGRIVGRTRDLKNSGDHDFYEIPNSIVGGETGAFATLPENSSTVLPDNVSSSRLKKVMEDVAASVEFKVACLAFGSLWTGNFVDQPGALKWSALGRWGTFPIANLLFPDPSGAEITGLATVPGGVLCFTERSTFSITPSQGGIYPFDIRSLSTTIGCIAPNSVQVMPNGAVIWLGKSGFYFFNGQDIALASSDIQHRISMLNSPYLKNATSVVKLKTSEYICWLASNDSQENDRAFVYDGEGWRERAPEKFSSVTTVRGPSDYVIACGTQADSTPTNHRGVWVLDHEVKSFIPKARTYIIETSWLGVGNGPFRQSFRSISLWLRETSTTGQITIKTYINGRKGGTPHETVTVPLHSTEYVPTAWGDILGAPGKEYIKRRSFWIKRDHAAVSVETVKFVIETTAQFEFFAMMVESTPLHSKGRTPRN